jgi:hypothetical protein
LADRPAEVDVDRKIPAKRKGHDFRSICGTCRCENAPCNAWTLSGTNIPVH